MPIKSFKPVTPARRYLSQLDYSDLLKKRPEKGLIENKPSTGGRNNKGQITSRFRGGGHKRHYRLIDFRRDKRNVPAKVVGLEYDPNRTAHIALLNYADGEKRYILAPVGLKSGDSVLASESADIQVGNALPLKKIPPGTTLHNVELRPGAGGKLGRSAGSMLQLVGFEEGYAQLRMPSGEMRIVSEECWATVGQVGNLEYENVVWGKAGRMVPSAIITCVSPSKQNSAAIPPPAPTAAITAKISGMVGNKAKKWETTWLTIFPKLS